MHISQLIRFARVSSHVNTINWNRVLLNFLHKPIGIIKLRRTFFDFFFANSKSGTINGIVLTLNIVNIRNFRTL